MRRLKTQRVGNVKDDSTVFQRIVHTHTPLVHTNFLFYFAGIVLNSAVNKSNLDFGYFSFNQKIQKYRNTNEWSLNFEKEI